MADWLQFLREKRWRKQRFRRLARRAGLRTKLRFSWTELKGREYLTVTPKTDWVSDEDYDLAVVLMYETFSDCGSSVTVERTGSWSND